VTVSQTTEPLWLADAVLKLNVETIDTVSTAINNAKTLKFANPLIGLETL
jgi:hypothetical protein